MLHTPTLQATIDFYREISVIKGNASERITKSMQYCIDNSCPILMVEVIEAKKNIEGYLEAGEIQVNTIEEVNNVISAILYKLP